MSIDPTDYVEVTFDPNEHPQQIKPGDYAEVVYAPTSWRGDPNPGKHVFSGEVWESGATDNTARALCVGSSAIVWGEGRAITTGFRITRLRRKATPVPTEPGFYLVQPSDSDASDLPYVVNLLHSGSWYQYSGSHYLTTPNITRIHREGRLFRLFKSETPTNGE